MGAVAGAAALVAVLFATDAFASEVPKLTDASSVTTGDSSADVTVTCPRGYAATGVSAELRGFDGVTISAMVPAGRQAHARATATRPVTSPWTLRAQAICVRRTADIGYTVASVSGRGVAQAVCPGGKELIGMGWSVGGGSRIALVQAVQGFGGPPGTTGTGSFPTGTGQFPTGTGQFPTGTGQFPTGTGQFPTGTGQFPTGTGQFPTGTGQFPTGTGQFPTGTGQFPTGQVPGLLYNAARAAAVAGDASRAEVSVTAVCATPGNNTLVAAAGIERRHGGTAEATATCPRGWHVTAPGLAIRPVDAGLIQLRTLRADPNHRSGRIVIVDPDQHGDRYGPRGELYLLCTS